MALHQVLGKKPIPAKKVVLHPTRKNHKLMRRKARCVSFRMNAQLARRLWGSINPSVLDALKRLTETHGFSVATGDLQLLDGRWYITHAGLLRIAARDGCAGIKTRFEKTMSDPPSGRWVFKATVYRRRASRGFTG